MSPNTTAIGAALAVCASLLAGSAGAQSAPPLVSAYVTQLAQQCGAGLAPGAALALAGRVDLNGDKLEDWVVDAARFPCPTRPRDFADAGAQVTVFLGRPDGTALPAFQKVAHGANLERKGDGRYVLSVNLAGADCDVAEASARCSRQLVWLGGESRFTLASPSIGGVAR